MKAFDLSKFRKTLTKSIEGLGVGFNDPSTWISTGNYALNYLISGDFNKGVPLGKVTVFAGESGCLPASATVKIRVGNSEATRVTVAELKAQWDSGAQNIEIDTPDGFQQITNWFDKGVLDMVRVETQSGLVTTCAVNHLLQGTGRAWIPAENVKVGDTVITVASDTDRVVAAAPVEPEECYDFTVDHPNHRYWGDGFSSHNSGKSYICSGNIVRHAQEQGIFVVLIDSENALDQSWLQALGVDTSEEKLLKLNMSMIDDVAKTISEFMKEYKAMPSDDRPKVLFVIDSLGMLLTPTDVNQFEAGEMKGDLGRKPKALTALVRNCVNMFGEYDVGMVVTNHSYASLDIFDPSPKISGGCLTAGHRVCLANNTTVPIEEVKVGDTVVTLGGDIEVAETFHFTDKEVFELVLEDGTVIKATAEHKFLTHASKDAPYIWKTVAELNENDEILSVLDHAD